MADESWCLFGSEALLKRLQALTQEISGVRQAEDIEYIHRMRVASRRLRAALTLFEDCLPRKMFPGWQKQIRRITRALGAARDTDVQLAFLQTFLDNLKASVMVSDRLQPASGPQERGQAETLSGNLEGNPPTPQATGLQARPAPGNPAYQAGLERLLLRLRQRRQQLQTDVLQALDRLEASRTVDELGQVLRQNLVQARLHRINPHAPSVYQQAYQAISLKLEELMAYDPYVYRPENVAELHALRIAAKRLRYTMEIFAPLYPGELKEPLHIVRDIQEMVGEIHDCDVWVQYLPQFLEEERRRTLEYLGHTRPFRRLAAGLLYLQQDRQQYRAQRYEEFVDLWKRAQKQGVWDHLRQTLQASLDIEPQRTTNDERPPTTEGLNPGEG